MMGRIPSNLGGFRCRACLGPVVNFELCSACHQIFRVQRAPASLMSQVVPITAVANPGQWYTWLLTYKTYHTERGAVVASLLYEFIVAHESAIQRALGGQRDLITVVPSKRGHSFVSQPLRRTLARVQPLAEELREVIRYRRDQRLLHRQYDPRVFSLVEDVSGSRILLLEDTWVTGATSISAAGHLLDRGAASVLVMPAARMVETAYWQADHPYLRAMTQPPDPCDPAYWPRA